MAKTNCTCGAPMAKHPVNAPNVAYPCLVALEASNVRVGCSWPGCAKKTRKTGLGPEAFCNAHRKAEFAGFMTICHFEGPSTLSRPLPTLAERVEAYETSKLPESRKTPITFENTRMQCGVCHGPLIMLNDHDWSRDLPNALSARGTHAGNVKPWGVAICRSCTLGVKAVA